MVSRSECYRRTKMLQTRNRGIIIGDRRQSMRCYGCYADQPAVVPSCGAPRRAAACLCQVDVCPSHTSTRGKSKDEPLEKVETDAIMYVDAKH